MIPIKMTCGASNPHPQEIHQIVVFPLKPVQDILASSAFTRSSSPSIFCLSSSTSFCLANIIGLGHLVHDNLLLAFPLCCAPACHPDPSRIVCVRFRSIRALLRKSDRNSTSRFCVSKPKSTIFFSVSLMICPSLVRFISLHPHLAYPLAISVPSHTQGFEASHNSDPQMERTKTVKALRLHAIRRLYPTSEIMQD